MCETATTYGIIMISMEFQCLLKTVWKWKNVCKYIVVTKCTYIVPVTHVYLL